MDYELWTSTLIAIQRAGKRVGWHGGRRKPVYANWLIVAMYIWSVWHDRTLSWACDRRSYGSLFRPRKPVKLAVSHPPTQWCRKWPSDRLSG